MEITMKGISKAFGSNEVLKLSLIHIYSDRTHIQIVLRDHLVSFQDIFNREHRQPPRYGAPP